MEGAGGRGEWACTPGSASRSLPPPKRTLSHAFFLHFPYPNTHPQDVEAAVFDGPASLSAAYANCSAGASALTRANSRVAPIAKLPCTGTSAWGNAYSASACEYGDSLGFEEAAEAAAVAAGGRAGDALGAAARVG